jgi:hypothetical protein
MYTSNPEFVRTVHEERMEQLHASAANRPRRARRPGAFRHFARLGRAAGDQWPQPEPQAGPSAGASPSAT